VDGLSYTIVVGEFARFLNDPDTIFNVWNSALPIESPNALGVTRPQGLATTVPVLNAKLRSPDYPQSTPVNWRSDERNRQMGQFGFRSRHPGGAGFLLGDGSVKFLKDSINVTEAYWRLSTRGSGDLVQGSDY